MTQTVLFIVGARPNFVKVAPVIHALRARAAMRVGLVHTGQHYDPPLSDAFVSRLDLPKPDHFLGVGSGSHAAQTARILLALEDVLIGEAPAAVVVPGDVNSTMAAAITAAKLRVPVAHLEAGLRSRDWVMPEEINRLVTDQVSDLLLCHSQEAVDNLIAEGVAAQAIALVGNTMIDTLLKTLAATDRTAVLRDHDLSEREYVLVTLHRPANVDEPQNLDAVLGVLAELAASLPVVVPLHPRTRARLGRLDLRLAPRLRLLEAMEYPEFVALEAGARFVITDSGGVQEETSVLGVPCLTYRQTTERGVTVELGTNRVVGTDPSALRDAGLDLLRSRQSLRTPRIPLWDGHAGERAADAITGLVEGRRPLRSEWWKAVS